VGPAVISTRRWVFAAAALGLLLRLAFALLYWTGQPLTHDEREYLALARSLTRGEGLRYPADEPAPGTGQQFGRAPGYPAFLALLAVGSPVEHVPVRVKVAQSAVGACGILLIAAIARRAAGNRAAVAAALIAAAYPPLVSIPSYALSETLYSTVALAAAWMLAKTEAGVKASATAAVLTGTAILIRPAMVFFIPLAAAWLLALPRRRAARNASAFVAITVCCLLPWTIRNYRTYGRWVLVASEGGVTFWTGNHPLATGDGDLATNPRLKQAEIEFRRAHAPATAEELEPLYYRDAFHWIRAHPAAWIALEARKLFFTIVPVGASYAVHSARYRIASAGSYLLLLPFAAAGVWRLRVRPATPELVAGAAVPLWLMAAATIAAGLVFFPQERFRIPVVDPALIVSAAALAGVRTHERISRRPDV
jgi:4-amino-4-deoxy-L-arabinose transferase-like glycosyltransferase